MGEVEAQLVRAHVRAGLAHVRAQPLAQRGVQQVGGGVVAHRGQARLALDGGRDRLAGTELALQRLERQRLVVAQPVHVDDPRAPGQRLHHAGVGDLAAALGVEGALLELGQQAPVDGARRAQHGLGLDRLVADEARRKAGLASEAEHVLMLDVDLAARLGARAATAATGPRGLARPLHQLLEALVVDRQPLLGEQLLGHLVGKAEGVVQPEGVLGRHPRGAVGLGPLDQLGQQPLALLERASEALLLGARPALDRRRLGAQLGIDVAHQLDHTLVQPAQERALDPEHPPLVHRAAHQAAQHVAALLVGGHDPVGHQERRPAAVIGEHAQRARRRVVLPVAAPRELLPQLDQRSDVLGLEDRGHVLHDRGHAVEAEAGVDVLERQLGQRAVLVQLVLHEDEVPELEEAVGVVAGTVVGAAELEATIEVELRARPAGTGRARLPEVVLATEVDDALVGHADRAPALDRLLVGAEPQLLVAAEDGDPDLLGIEAEALGRELPGERRGAVLEVVADREVAQHLEERQVALGRAHDLDVHSAKALLTGGQALGGRLLLTTEIRLERLHAGRGQQYRGVVDRWNQRRGGQPPVPSLLEEGEELLADLGGRHDPWSLGAGSDAPCGPSTLATSVQFGPNPPSAVEVWPLNMCNPATPHTFHA